MPNPHDPSPDGAFTVDDEVAILRAQVKDLSAHVRRLEAERDGAVAEAAGARRDWELLRDRVLAAARVAQDG
jgi:outer membrane murein-binding lipoprotein Lpp